MDLLHTTYGTVSGEEERLCSGVCKFGWWGWNCKGTHPHSARFNPDDLVTEEVTRARQQINYIMICDEGKSLRGWTESSSELSAAYSW